MCIAKYLPCVPWHGLHSRGEVEPVSDIPHEEHTGKGLQSGSVEADGDEERHKEQMDHLSPFEGHLVCVCEMLSARKDFVGKAKN